MLKKKKVLKFTYWKSGSGIEIQKTINIFSQPNKTLGDPSHSALTKTLALFYNKIKDLFARLLIKDNTKRISANDLMSHPFVTGGKL